MEQYDTSTGINIEAEETELMANNVMMQHRSEPVQLV